MSLDLGDVTVGVKTFLRPDRLDRCLNSLHGKGFAQVIVADDGEIDEEKRQVYRFHGEHLALKLLRLERDSGLAYGRNQIVDRCETEFLLMLDDDQAVPENVGDLKTILVADQEVGGVAGFWSEYGRIKCTSCNIYEYEDYIVKDILGDVPRREVGSLTYYLFDHINNSTLYRTGVLKETPWDPYYKIGKEHLDFYLAHKRLGKWRFAATPDVLIEHFPSTKGKYKASFRSKKERIQRSLDYFLGKWDKCLIVEGMMFELPPPAIKPRVVSFLHRNGFPPRFYILVDHLWRIPSSFRSIVDSAKDSASAWF